MWMWCALAFIEWLWLLGYVVIDWLQARWLPWWRRYLPSGLLLLRCLLLLTADDAKWPRFALAMLAIVAARWNNHTADRNRKGGNDQRKLEASRAAELTTVQSAAFRRQVSEGA